MAVIFTKVFKHFTLFDVNSKATPTYGISRISIQSWRSRASIHGPRRSGACVVVYVYGRRNGRRNKLTAHLCAAMLASLGSDSGGSGMVRAKEKFRPAFSLASSPVEFVRVWSVRPYARAKPLVK